MIQVSSADEQKRIATIMRLRKYRSKVQEYQACKDLLEQMYPSAVQVLSDMPMHRGDVYEPERWAIKRESQYERMQRSLDAMREAMDDIERLTDLVTDQYKTVLIRRYMMNESYEAISEKMHCHRNTVKNWHDSAIRMIVKTL